MGQIILGDPRDERLYTIKEISESVGIPIGTLRCRARRLGIAMDKGGFAYPEVLTMIRPPQKRRGQRARPDMIDHLKRQLKKDGYL